MATSATGIDNRKTIGHGSFIEEIRDTTEAEDSLVKGKQQNESTSDFETADNSFDFSKLSGLLNDPSIQNLADHIVNDPAFRIMAEELQHDIQPGGEQGLLQAHTKEYFNTVEQLLENPQFQNMAERLSSSIIQDPALASILQNLKNLDQPEEEEMQWAQVQSSSSLRPIVNEIEREGPSATLRYMNDPQVLGMLGNALGFSFPGELTLENEFSGTSASELSPGKDHGQEKEIEFLLHHAVSIGDTKALHDLLGKGADTTKEDGEGRVALHLACGYGELDCAEALLEAGVPVDSVDRNNNTALHYAAGYGKQDCVELLMKYGAAVTLQNLDGKTPSDVARLNNQTEIIRLLEKYAFL